MLPTDYCIDVLQGVYQRARYHPDLCVRLWDYEMELKDDSSEELDEIESRCCGFFCFMYYCFRTEHVYNAFYEQFGHGFSFMENDDYRSHGIVEHDCDGCRFRDPLFFLVDHNKFYSPEHQRKKMASLRLERELFKFYEDNAMTQKTIRDRNIVINKIHNMIAREWSTLPEFRVEFFGSTRTRLASDSTDLDLAIVIPQYINASHETLRSLKKVSGSIFNMQYLASKLRQMGMLNVKFITGARVPICKFVDPETNLQCDINASSSLGVENSQLIEEYRKLDSRVGPFLFALKYFVKRRNINDNQGGTMSSYAYCLLGIYYLMNYNHDSYILPNLQDFQGNGDVCSGHGCKFNITNHYVDNQQVCYHDCIEVISGSKYQLKKEARRQGNATTQWDGFCLDNLGKIMLEFFKWASKIENLTAPMSIRYSGVEIPNAPHKWFKKSIIIQDPFILSKNVASSCSEKGLNKILAEFQRAAKLLEETDMTFVDMCNSRAEPVASYSHVPHTAMEVPLRITQPRIKKNNKNQFRHRMPRNNNNPINTPINNPINNPISNPINHSINTPINHQINNPINYQINSNQYTWAHPAEKYISLQ